MNNDILDQENYLSHYLRFEQRQAGVSVVYAPNEERYYYNTYCIDITSMKELLSVEHTHLEDALSLVNSEFETWNLVSFEDTKGCGSCHAKS